MTTVGGTVNKMIDINENINFLKSDSSYWQLNKSITMQRDRRVLYIIILITIHLLNIDFTDFINLKHRQK